MSRRPLVVAAVVVAGVGCGKSSDHKPVPVEPTSVAATDDRHDAAPPPEPDEPPVVAAVVETPLVEQWQPVPGLSDAIDLEAIDERFCALRKTGAIVCWSAGEDEDGSVDLTTTRLGALGSARAIGGDGGKLCAVDRRGRVACYQRDDGADKVQKIAGLRDIAEVDANYAWTCALDRRGKVHCWSQEYGEPPSKPVPVEGTPPLTALQMDSAAICALDAKRQPWCWYDPEDGGGRVSVSLRTCERGVSYYPGDRDDRCTEAPPRLVGPVQDFAVYADNEPPQLFYARIDDVGYFARDDTPYDDDRPIRKDPFADNPPLNRYMERFPLPPDTVRLVAEPDLFCAVTRGDVTYCWMGPYGEMPRRTAMPAPVAVAINGSMVCALTAAGKVHCALPELEE